MSARLISPLDEFACARFSAGNPGLSEFADLFLTKIIAETSAQYPLRQRIEEVSGAGKRPDHAGIEDVKGVDLGCGACCAGRGARRGASHNAASSVPRKMVTCIEKGL